MKKVVMMANPKPKRIAIITGASSGLGAEYARQVDADRAPGQELDEIWLVARRLDRLEALAATLDTPCRIFDLDLTEENALPILADELSEADITVKLLVNSAGFGQVGAFAGIDADIHRSMLRLNVEVLTMLCDLVMPYLAEGSGIINVASVAGFMPQTNFNVYAASKAYVIRFSRALNDELKRRGIHVTAVCPGPMETEFFTVAGRSGSSAEENQRIAGKIKSIGLEDPVKVVRLSLKHLQLGRDMAVTGIMGKLLRVVGKLVPHRFVLWAERMIGM